jgi:uncharacterized protein (DUF362 family)
METPKTIQSQVGLVKTSPETVIDDYGHLMRSLDYTKFFPRDSKIVLKLNLSWSLYYPACSTQPWQLEGVLKTLIEDGYKNIVAVENKTVVTDPLVGAKNNKWLPVLERYGIEFIRLDKTKWVKYEPRSKLLVLDKIFHTIEIPELFLNNNVIHLPTLKTHGHTTMTGAMKNAFGGLLKEVRHHCHRHIQ